MPPISVPNLPAEFIILMLPHLSAHDHYIMRKFVWEWRVIHDRVCRTCVWDGEEIYEEELFELM